MFDLTPIATQSLVWPVLAFAASYFGLQSVIRKKWLRLVPGRMATYYAGAVLLAVTILFAALPLWNNVRLLVGLIAAGFVILVSGAWDERTPLAPGRQLFLQTVAALLAVAGGWTIQYISQPFGGGVIAFSPLSGGVLAIAWLLLFMNAINWLDGIDGLAGSVSGLALATLVAVSLLPSVQDGQTFSLALIGVASVGGWLFWNWPPARVYLGTTGSWWLGLYLGIVAIHGGGKIVTTLLVLALPVVDVAVVVVERLLAGQPPWQGDRERHLHHRLLRRGWSHRAITLAAVAVTALLGSSAIRLQTSEKMIAFLAATVLLVIAGAALTFTRAQARWPRSGQGRKGSKVAAVILISGLVVLVTVTALAQKPCRNFKAGSLTIADTTWSVALATNPAEHSRGLMKCARLPAGSGMYFIFKQPTTNPFWMKDMLLPLDIIWIRDNRIIGIEHNVPVAGDDPTPALYYAPQPYTATLELPAGEAQQYSLAVGQEVTLVDK